MNEEGKTLEEYNKEAQDFCPTCKTKLYDKIDLYEHDGGWIVKGFDKKQWLSKRCPKCKYDWSLWKIGVPRPVGKSGA